MQGIVRIVFIRPIIARLRCLFLCSFTVACDSSPFWNTLNRRERFFRVKGMRSARSVARKWVRDNPYGQARVLGGHHYWSDEKEGSVGTY